MALKGNCERGENLELGYFEQEVKGDNKTTCIEELWQEFPIPFVPTSAIFCPRSMVKFNGLDSGSSKPITRSCVSNSIFPGVRP